MKVYVDELPKSCKDCFFCEHIEEDVDGKGRDEVACYFEGFLNNVLLGETFSAEKCKHLHSLSDYTKQVRKEVCEEIRNISSISEYHEYENDEFKYGDQYVIKDYELDQIQGVTK